MKKQDEHKVAIAQKIIDKFFNTVLLFVSILFLGVGLYALVDNRLVVKEAEIPDSFKKSAMADRAYPDIGELKKTNNEIVAWLSIDDTPIDYPITQYTDNSKYLTTDYKNKHSIAGNPFVDYRNNFFKDDYTVIYGHRMNQKKMFGSIIEYADASYLQKHLSGTITIAETTFKLEVIAYSVEDVSRTNIYDLANNRNGKNQELLSSIARNATTINGNYTREKLQSKEINGWRLILLSTCDKDSRHYRDVLLLRVGEQI